MPLKIPVYLDHHATTPLDPAVFEGMHPYFLEKFGNASSRSHPFGWEAQEAVERAREDVARLLSASPGEIIFTSGATESVHLALEGAFEGAPKGRNHFVATAVEHRAVSGELARLERRGARVTLVPVDRTGRVDPKAVEAALGPDTLVISVIAAGNEVGTIQPLAEIGRIARKAGVLFHVDAAQAAGKIPLDVRTLGIDLLSLSAHKFHGPKGVGALFVRKGMPFPLAPVLPGGGQEGGLRSGTLNVPGIVGLGEAARLAREGMREEAARIAGLRDRLQAQLTTAVPDAVVNGPPAERLPNNLSVSFPGVDAGALLAALAPKVACSAGSACSSGSKTASPVLAALGIPPEIAQGTIRLALGRFTTEQEVDFAAQEVARQVRRLRKLNPAHPAR